LIGGRKDQSPSQPRVDHPQLESRQIVQSRDCSTNIVGGSASLRPIIPPDVEAILDASRGLYRIDHYPSLGTTCSVGVCRFGSTAQVALLFRALFNSKDWLDTHTLEGFGSKRGCDLARLNYPLDEFTELRRDTAPGSFFSG
jgi:hypothetical protein